MGRRACYTLTIMARAVLAWERGMSRYGAGKEHCAKRNPLKCSNETSCHCLRPPVPPTFAKWAFHTEHMRKPKLETIIPK